MPSVISDKQRERLRNRPDDEADEKSLKARRLNDFYVRKALTRWLDSIDDINLALETLPAQQLEKTGIITREMVTGLFKITEKLVEALEPSPIAAADELGVRHVFRYFKIEMPCPFPPMKTATAVYEVKYVPGTEEVSFFDQLTTHIGNLETIYNDSERNSYIYESSKQFEEQILQPLRARKGNVEVRLVSVIGFGNPGTEEAAKRFNAAKREILDKAKELLKSHTLPATEEEPPK